MRFAERSHDRFQQEKVPLGGTITAHRSGGEKPSKKDLVAGWI